MEVEKIGTYHAFDVGQIWIAKAPDNRPEIKDRPVLVLQGKEIYPFYGKVRVVTITHTNRFGPKIILEDGIISTISLLQTRIVPIQSLYKYVGVVDNHTMELVENGLKYLMFGEELHSELKTTLDTIINLNQKLGGNSDNISQMEELIQREIDNNNNDISIPVEVEKKVYPAEDTQPVVVDDKPKRTKRSISTYTRLETAAIVAYNLNTVRDLVGYGLSYTTKEKIKNNPNREIFASIGTDSLKNLQPLEKAGFVAMYKNSKRDLILGINRPSTMIQLYYEKFLAEFKEKGIKL
ncbi:MAG: type II toxin-antitoxin system PemK/MazF family toxin [Herbinix sp.]|nr:type II toxin-antitoxin system PemK/MazF family toxin [Herbinix sp.]